MSYNLGVIPAKYATCTMPVMTEKTNITFETTKRTTTKKVFH